MSTKNIEELCYPLISPSVFLKGLIAFLLKSPKFSTKTYMGWESDFIALYFSSGKLEMAVSVSSCCWARAMASKKNKQ